MLSLVRRVLLGLTEVRVPFNLVKLCLNGLKTLARRVKLLLMLVNALLKVVLDGFTLPKSFKLVLLMYP